MLHHLISGCINETGQIGLHQFSCTGLCLAIILLWNKLLYFLSWMRSIWDLNCTGFPVRGSSRHFWRCGSRHQGNFKYVRNFFFFFFFPCSWKTRWWNFRHLSSTYIKISPYIFIWQMPLPDFHIWKVGLCCTSWQECYKDKYAKQEWDSLGTVVILGYSSTSYPETGSSGKCIFSAVKKDK